MCESAVERRTRFLVPVVIGSALGLATCRGEALRERATHTVADSLGVEIVTSRLPAWAEGAAWSIDPTPTLTIGGVDGDDDYTLYGVRFATVLGDGRVAISNAGTSQIRVYDRLGSHRFDVGRRGAGPGEFRSLGRVWGVRGDSIMAYDGRLSRLTVFDGQGRLGRTVQLRPTEGARQAFGMRPLGSGDLLVEGVVPPRDGPPRPGLFDGGARVFARYSPTGEYLNHIGGHAAGPNWGFTVDGSMVYTSAPFSVAPPPSTADGTWLYLGSGTDFQVERRAPDGRLDRIVRWEAELREVDSRVVERFRDWRLGRSAEFRRHAEAMLDGLVFPPRMPTYQRLLPDAGGGLWVEQYRAPWEEEQRWWAFDAGGRWLGEPRLPVDVRLLEVGRDYVLGVRRDEMDVESVVVFALHRDGR